MCLLCQVKFHTGTVASRAIKTKIFPNFPRMTVASPDPTILASRITPLLNKVALVGCSIGVWQVKNVASLTLCLKEAKCLRRNSSQLSMLLYIDNQRIVTLFSVNTTHGGSNWSPSSTGTFSSARYWIVSCFWALRKRSTEVHFMRPSMIPSLSIWVLKSNHEVHWLTGETEKTGALTFDFILILAINIRSKLAVFHRNYFWHHIHRGFSVYDNIHHPENFWHNLVIGGVKWLTTERKEMASSFFIDA